MSGEVVGVGISEFSNRRITFEPKEPYIGVELYSRDLLEELAGYFARQDLFLLGINGTWTVGQFVNYRKKLLNDEKDKILDYPFYPERGKPFRPVKKPNENKKYELAVLKKLKESRIRKSLSMEELMRGVMVGLERYVIEEALKGGCIPELKYHDVHAMYDL